MRTFCRADQRCQDAQSGDWRRAGEEMQGVALIANIQALRAVVALMIVLVHCAKLLQPLQIIAPDWLAASVDIFFVISGFIMVHTTSRSGVGAVAFLRDRLIRIIPVYWLFTIVVFASNRLVPGLGNWHASADTFFRSLAFLPQGDPPQFFPLLYVGWTLNLELYFYVLFTIGIAASTSPLRRVAIVTAMISLPVLVAQAMPAGSFWQFYGMPMAYEFCSGMALALVLNSRRQNSGTLGIGFLILGVTLMVLDPVRAITSDAFARYSVVASLIVAGAVLCESAGICLKARLPLAVGAASYSLYCTHPLVISVFNNAQRRIPVLGSPLGALAAVACAIIATVVFALVVHRAYEKPVGRWLHRRLIFTPTAKTADANASMATVATPQSPERSIV